MQIPHLYQLKFSLSIFRLYVLFVYSRMHRSVGGALCGEPVKRYACHKNIMDFTILQSKDEILLLLLRNTSFE